MTKNNILESVKQLYASVARSTLDNNAASVRSVAQAFGYSAEELESLPPQANMGLSCGNPTATANLREGEVVVDLGCGGGLDVLLAAKKVGATGKAIGIDMTADMIERARAGAAKLGATNVDFHVAQIDAMPLADASVDCILSNCVINLASDKPAVFREMIRVLKPGGRLAISDIALRRDLPPEIAQSMIAYVACFSGAMKIGLYQRLLNEAGFQSVAIRQTGADLNVYSQTGAFGCCPPTNGSKDDACCATDLVTIGGTKILDDTPSRVMLEFDANEYAASVEIYAVKAND